MPENVIEIRLVAKDEGVAQALSQVQQGLAKTTQTVEKGSAAIRRFGDASFWHLGSRRSWTRASAT